MKQRVHTSFTTSDLGAAVAFYSRLFAAEPTKLKPGYASFRLEEPPLHLSLIAGTPPPVTRDEHHGIELFDAAELGVWRNRIHAAGLASRIESGVTCCYAVADKVWVADPDGRAWEIWRRTDETEARREPVATKSASDQSASGAGCCVPTCCQPSA